MVDSTDEITCPACGKAMKKIFVEQPGFNVDICTKGCGGIFFDNREYKKFDEKHEDILALQQSCDNKEGTYKKTDTNEVRTCPVCYCKMVKHYANPKKTVEIDECYGCGSVFLDKGELEKIREEFETEKEASKYFNDKTAQMALDGMNADLSKTMVKVAGILPFYNSISTILTDRYIESRDKDIFEQREEVLKKLNEKGLGE